MDFGKLKIGVGIIFVVLTAYVLSVNAAGFAISIYADHLSDNLGEAEFPEEPFQNYGDKNDSSYRDYLMKNTEENGLSHRIRLHGLALNDHGTLGYRMSVEGETEETAGLRGYTTRGCSVTNQEIHTYCRSNESYIHYDVSGNWLGVVSQTGEIDQVLDEERNLEKLEHYFRRVNYYEKRLNPEYQEPKVRGIYYNNNSGLDVLGRNISQVKIDNENYRFNRKDIVHINKTLEAGNHQISVDGEKVSLTVYRRLPFAEFEEKSINLPSGSRISEFNSVRLERNGWEKTVNLTERPQEVEVPERFIYKTENSYSETEVRPIKIIWSAKNYSISTVVGREENEAQRSEKIQAKYGFGMSIEELEKIQKISSMVDLPLTTTLPSLKGRNLS